MQATAATLLQRLRQSASREKADVLRRFFKTGPGQYGEGDVFLGVMVPSIRRIVKEFPDAPLREVRKLLASPYHEARLLALLFLVRRFSRGTEAEQEVIYRLYLRSTRSINNWDLVDLSAPNIVGTYLLNRDRMPLSALARSRNIWKRRIAILATFAFIREGEFDDTFRIAELLMQDDHDLLHKATGWMLREIGKRDQQAEERFLKRHCRRMPRTMLRYAVERFPERKRKAYLNGTA